MMGSEERDVCRHGNWSSSEWFQVKFAVSSLQPPVKPLSDWKSAHFQEDLGCASLFDPWEERRKAQQSCRLTDEFWVQVSDLTSGFLCKSFIDPERRKVEEQHVQVEVPASSLQIPRSSLLICLRNFETGTGRAALMRQLLQWQ